VRGSIDGPNRLQSGDVEYVNPSFSRRGLPGVCRPAKRRGRSWRGVSRPGRAGAPEISFRRSWRPTRIASGSPRPTQANGRQEKRRPPNWECPWRDGLDV
jgi:hypothetical protein